MEENAMGLMDFVKRAKSVITEITGMQLADMNRNKADLLLVDIREPAEIAQGYIEGMLAVPRGMLEAAADFEYPKRNQTLVEARKRPVVLYCASGGRSALAAVTLKLMGFNEVYSLAGGIQQWVADNRPLMQEAS